MRDAPLIEPLEDRIAPAAVTIAPNGRSASYTDANGDTVHVSTNKGAFVQAQFIFDPNSTGQLTELLLSGYHAFNGASIAFTVTPAASGGSLQVPVGYVDAIGLSLKSLTLPGDLGRIDVGGGSSSTAIGKLSVNSIGLDGSGTQGGLTASTVSNITGTASLIDIAGNLDGTLQLANFKTHAASGNIRVLNVGGSIDGSNSSGSATSLQLGQVAFTGTLGKVTIQGGINGGASAYSGSVFGNATATSVIDKITVLGSVPNDPDPNPLPNVAGTSILGGAGQFSGAVSAVVLANATVAGDVRGGTGEASGLLQGQGEIISAKIDGSLIGANLVSNTLDGAYSGTVFGGAIGTVVIEKNIAGGSGLISGRVISTGILEKVTVMGNVYGGAAGQSGTSGVSGAIEAHILGTAIVEGALIGGNAVAGDPYQLASFSGIISSDTTIAKVIIGKNIQGGSGPNSGEVLTGNGNLASITIGATDTADTSSILGGSGAGSGQINVTGALGKATLSHDLTGGAGSSSGEIAASGAISSILIQGSVTGGAGNDSGNIFTPGLLKSLVIAKNFTGGNSGSTLLTNSGYIQAGTIASLRIGGAFTSGTAGSGGEDSCGAIRAVQTIGSLTVASIAGNSTNPAIISAVGRANLASNATSDVAMSSIKVTGNVAYADILAGYGTDTDNGTMPLGVGVNADAQISSVYIGGNMTATNIVAGVGAGPNGFGTAGSSDLTGAGVSNLDTIVSKISSIVVKGTITPTASTTDSYGLAAQYVVAASVAGVKLSLHAGPENDTFALGAEQQLPSSGGDTFLYEVPGT